jgi:phosphoglycolate phosphatase
VLLLFDIDGTLVLRGSAEHAEAVLHALREVHGIDPTRARFEAAGRTDADIARQILSQEGVPRERIEAEAQKVFELVADHYDATCPDDLRHLVAPGVPEVLPALARDHRLSLVTGNLERVAHRKLGAAGIGHHFERGQGGFGSDHEDRIHLPAIARERAGGVPPGETVVIGDTPRDIACARHDGCHVIAVTTGPYEAADLQDADVVLDHAADLPAAIERLAS